VLVINEPTGGRPAQARGGYGRWVTIPGPASQAEHNRQTQDAYDRLAAVLVRFPSDLACLAGVPTFIIYRVRLAG
jgi:hypothetical protein